MAKKKESRKTVTAPAPRPGVDYRLLIGGGLLAALFAAFWIYSPVLNAPFVFDDEYLPFSSHGFPPQLKFWIMGNRPVLMFSYWLNFTYAGLDTWSYHVVNVFIHAISTVLVFFVLRDLLRRSGFENMQGRLFALFGSALFLVHPLQTESVAYVASRSESLTGMLLLAAFLVFLHQKPQGISWTQSAAVLLLYGLAVGSKEHAAVFPLVLVMTDYFWFTGFSIRGIRHNWRVYGPIVGLAAVGGIFIIRVLAAAKTAGFALKDFTWYQYFFTECRALFVYMRLFLWPAGLTADYDFPISRNLMQHGAIAGLCLLLLLGIAALYYRKKYPLACYGFLLFVVLLAPTSSFVPIQDPIAERRMYLPLLGLMLMAFEALRRVRVRREGMAAALAVLVLAGSVAAYQRNQVWSSPVALWQDTIQKSPAKYRAHFQLAFAYYDLGRCADSIAEYRKAAALKPPNYDLLVDSALAYDCMNQQDEALARYEQAAKLQQTGHIYSLIGMAYAKQSRWPQALDALNTAEKLDPTFFATFVNRAGVRAKLNEFAAAAQDYRRALALEPSNEAALKGLAYVESQLRTAR